ncbi:YopJ family acetyltransferase [Xanthomonas arboricola]|uniref:YopJ family acetyltransferase n=1 Tax=Xanthomonas arboricola TaxID=56448 RepID=UPI000E0EF052|nr:YopJ family acetyltransferase [Xanthomonas arboricola]
MKKFFSSIGRSSRSQHSNSSNHNQMPASGSSTRDYASDNLNAGSAFDSLPSKPRRKAKQLQDSIEQNSARMDESLEFYAKAVVGKLLCNEQPTTQITELDINNLEKIISPYNSKYKYLNLRSFVGRKDFVDSVSSWRTPGICFRGVMRLGGNNDLHHIALDVRNHADGHTTVIALEPAMATDLTPLKNYSELQENLKASLGDKVSFAVIEAGAQKSTVDCTIFSLNYALRAYYNRDTFTDWHNDLKNTGTIDDKKPPPQNDMILKYGKLCILDGMELLPASFYKHAHANSTLEELESLRPGISSSSLGEGESLEDRMESFRVNREERSYSSSIELSRARKIRKAIES